MCLAEFDWEAKHRRERAWHNGLGPERIKRLAEIDCKYLVVTKKNWVYCDALDSPYCLRSKKPCTWRVPADERKNKNDTK